MRKRILLAVLFAAGLRAQDISGEWQATRKSDAGEDRRLIVKIAKGDDVSWKATIFSVDDSFDQGFPCDSVTLRGSTLK
jgi:hypothetical protein